MNTRRTSARLSPARRTALVCTALAAATAVGTAGCTWNGADVRSASESYTVKEKVTVVDIDAYAGDITLTAAGPERRTVGVTEDLEYDKTKPRTEHTVDGNTLRLSTDDCGGNGDTCAVGYTVAVPAAMDVRLKTGVGTVTVRGTAGKVSAHTDGGDIRMLKSRAPKVTADTGGGDVSATFAAAPSRVRAESGGGDVKVLLPRAEYAVNATTGGGTREVTVPTGSASPHKITARSGGGDVSVLPAP
ncbi:DUF4097 family beta strand repeat-containing protein [Streptomyces iconiensis]|uniref:DUF4097 family beta strand repeat-containing protein n=1 Tax=Streptomyces iconiensis TaxID=1384038 RepID=A0ABT6ZUW6_9ACTN|nr:DUF4097 family beta strand repeat-containing protein [Streptomyces iconiensis]MDJ1132855.1 DUF4097 family beta strand repeat-containing protein [Streptomyces iconiensis]